MTSKSLLNLRTVFHNSYMSFLNRGPYFYYLFLFVVLKIAALPAYKYDVCFEVY